MEGGGGVRDDRERGGEARDRWRGGGGVRDDRERGREVGRKNGGEG